MVRVSYKCERCDEKFMTGMSKRNVDMYRLMGITKIYDVYKRAFEIRGDAIGCLLELPEKCPKCGIDKADVKEVAIWCER